MTKVQIYNTQEEMWKQLGRKIYRNNLKSRGTLEDLYEKAMLGYKEESGFNKRFLEAQEKRKKKEPWVSTFSPDMVHLPKKEQEKFNEQYCDLGKDLELTVLVCLSAMGNKYSFGVRNSGELPNSFEEGVGYDTIASLAHGVKGELSKITYFGITFTPTFYTTREEVAIIPEHISNDVEGYLREIKENPEKQLSPP